VFLTVDGYTPEQVARHLAHHEINAWHGHNYAWEVTAALGIRHAGSAVRISLSHYTDESDVQRLLDAMAALR
jgi:selenocysteine lyase/cysteine desulfurase